MRRLVFLFIGAVALLAADGDHPRRRGRPGGGEPAHQVRKGGGPGERRRGPNRPAGGGGGAVPTEEQTRRGLRGAAGNSFLRQGNSAAAAAAFRKQLEKDPDSGALHVGLGKALARVGQCEEALENLWPYVGTMPFGAEAALSAGTCSSRLGLLDDAIYFDRLAVELDPGSARALTSLALDLDSAHDDVGVAQTLDDLLYLRKDRDASAYARAVIALRQGDMDTFDIVGATWERDDGPSQDLQRLRVQSWLDMGDPFEAMHILGGLKKVRASAQVRLLRVETQRRLGAVEEARAFLDTKARVVNEGIDADAVETRVLVDEGQLAAAAEILARYEDPLPEELAASAWYLARARKDEAAMTRYAARYDQVNESRLRTLDQLVPFPG